MFHFRLRLDAEGVLEFGLTKSGLTPMELEEAEAENMDYSE